MSWFEIVDERPVLRINAALETNLYPVRRQTDFCNVCQTENTDYCHKAAHLKQQYILVRFQ